MERAMQTGIRLQKLLSAAGVASRRHAEALILEGRVSVNGHVVRELGTRADPDRDQVRVDGSRIGLAKRRRYVLMNKPRGYVTTRSDPQGRPTVLDLLRSTSEYLYPVGRLDYESEGLVLLTNDGDLAARLMHPRHAVEREYHVRVRGIPDVRTLTRLSRGIVLEGRRTAPAGARVIEGQRGARGDQSVMALILREGRSRQVRRMCEAVGHPVVRLRRVRIGPLRDPTLKTGAYRELTVDEVRRLKKVAGNAD